MPLPRATADLPPLDARPDQARSCEEVLVRPPGKDGAHLWILVEKRGLGSRQAGQALARAAQAPEDAITSAGARDREGVCQQWFGLPEERCENAGALPRAGAHGKLRVLRIARSGRPFGPDEVVRLRWRVRIAGGAAGDGYLRARAILDRLRRDGLPNWQIMRRGDDLPRLARLGLRQLQGRRLPGGHRGAVPEGASLGAAQDRLFNRWLAARIADGLFGRVISGDVVAGADGRPVVVEDPAAWQPRIDAWEAVVLGPLFGSGCLPAAGEAAAREEALLAAAGLDHDRTARLHGGRRQIRVQPRGPVADPAGADLQLVCELPADAFVDGVLAELLGWERITGADIEADEDEEDEPIAAAPTPAPPTIEELLAPPEPPPPPVKPKPPSPGARRRSRLPDFGKPPR